MIASTEDRPAEVRGDEDQANTATTLLTLGRHMCKWPLGDPLSDAFSFCGQHTSGRFCEEHARVAFDPAPPKRSPRRRWQRRSRLTLAFMDY